MLVQAGADEIANDHVRSLHNFYNVIFFYVPYFFQQMKSPGYYRGKSSELDRSLLHVVPEAPRVSKRGPPQSFDWNMFFDNDSANNVQNILLFDYEEPI